MTTRQCRKCGEVKPLDEANWVTAYNPVTHKPNGFRPDCRKCHNARTLERRRARDEKTYPTWQEPLDNEDAVRRGEFIETLFDIIRQSNPELLPVCYELANRMLEPSIPYGAEE